MEQTIEQKAGGTILQRNKEITVGDRTFSVAPPSTATLILASEAISLLPQETLDGKKIVEEVLYIAKDCRVLGDILAILILGAKNLKETVTEKVEKRRLFRSPRIEIVERVIDRKAELAEWLLLNISPKELRQTFTKLVQDFQLGDFFGITTFLIGINLLRPTKVD